MVFCFDLCFLVETLQWIITRCWKQSLVMSRLTSIASYVECLLTLVKQILHMRLLQFPLFSCVTRSHNKVFKEDAYRVALGETNSSHSSLLILGGQVGTRRGRSVSGRGRKWTLCHSFEFISSSWLAVASPSCTRAWSMFFMCEWANVFRTRDWINMKNTINVFRRVCLKMHSLTSDHF